MLTYSYGRRSARGHATLCLCLMTDIAWEIDHSIVITATREFAWRHMTNVANWNDPPAGFGLDGPFVTGARGVTRMPGQETKHWRLREVEQAAAGQA